MDHPPKSQRDANVDLSRLVEIGCIICRRPAEVHHLRLGAGMSQRGKQVIPRCPEHHRTGGHGVAYHAGKEAFEQVHGTEDELWLKTQHRLTQHKERWGIDRTGLTD